jgi:transcriptional regulator with XRE-family HTH domain
MTMMLDIRSERKRQGYSAASLAVAAGLSITTIMRAERGNKVSPNTLRHIFRVLGVDLNG